MRLITWKRLSNLVAVAVLVLLAMAVAWIFRVTDQINSTGLFTCYAQPLYDYKVAHGTYPTELALLPPTDTWRCGAPPALGLDYWGHPIHYESRGEAFILVSYGHDGVPDGLDYWQLRETNTWDRDTSDICGDWNADQVFSDRWHLRFCSK